MSLDSLPKSTQIENNSGTSVNPATEEKQKESLNSMELLNKILKELRKINFNLELITNCSLTNSDMEM